MSTTPVTIESLQAELAAAKAKLEAKNNRPLTFKVAEKSGGVSVYGLNARYPITLYRNQMEKLLDAAPEIRAFIKANESKLPVK